nr:MAG TPA: hypothetical protein [Caudoviricetes sp.]
MFYFLVSNNNYDRPSLHFYMSTLYAYFSMRIDVYLHLQLPT